MEDVERMMSYRSRPKKPSVGIICCFTGTTHHQRHASFDVASATASFSHPSPVSHPSPRGGWFTWKNHHVDVPTEMKGKCRSFISRMRHRRHASAEFSYDPLSYSLNFDHDADDDLRATSFSNRFPTTPRAFETPTSGGHLRRGFDVLEESIKTSRRNKSMLPETVEEVATPVVVRRLEESIKTSRRNKSMLPETVEEVATPVVISPSNREILVQMC